MLGRKMCRRWFVVCCGVGWRPLGLLLSSPDYSDIKLFICFFKFATGWILVEDPYSKTFDFWGCANCAYFKPKHLSICFKKTAITFFVSVKWQMIVNSDSYISLLCVGHLSTRIWFESWRRQDLAGFEIYMLEEQGHPSRGTFVVTFTLLRAYGLN